MSRRSAPSTTNKEEGITKRARTSSAEQEKEDYQEYDKWVQCVKCEKWRKLPCHIDMHTLPENWYCTLNEETARASCDVACDTEGVPEVSLKYSNSCSYSFYPF